MRLIIAALLGAIVLFAWGVVSHMVLPIGEMGHRMATSEDVVLAALKEGLPAGGVDARSAAESCAPCGTSRSKSPSIPFFKGGRKVAGSKKRGRTVPGALI
jgi:hypothetical protein